MMVRNYFALLYGETADIWRINQGLTRSQEKGFKLDATSGEWGMATIQTFYSHIALKLSAGRGLRT
jgi:hypothetical protein